MIIFKFKLSCNPNKTTHSSLAQTDFAKMCATIHSFMLKSEAAVIGTYKSRQGGPLFHHSIIPTR
jgi:hypothetical protein